MSIHGDPFIQCLSRSYLFKATKVFQFFYYWMAPSSLDQEILGIHMCMNMLSHVVSASGLVHGHTWCIGATPNVHHIRPSFILASCWSFLDWNIWVPIRMHTMVLTQQLLCQKSYEHIVEAWGIPNLSILDKSFHRWPLSWGLWCRVRWTCEDISPALPPLHSSPPPDALQGVNQILPPSGKWIQGSPQLSSPSFPISRAPPFNLK